MATPTKLQVATELLNQALRLYYEGDAYYAALHLAGAAEEVLGVYVKAQGETPAFQSMLESTTRMTKFFNVGGIESNPRAIADLLNHAKNSTKHKFGKGDHYIDFDARWEARELIDMAVSDYYRLMSRLPLEETELIRRFNADRGGA